MTSQRCVLVEKAMIYSTSGLDSRRRMDDCSCKCGRLCRDLDESWNGRKHTFRRQRPRKQQQFIKAQQQQQQQQQSQSEMCGMNNSRMHNRPKQSRKGTISIIGSSWKCVHPLLYYYLVGVLLLSSVPFGVVRTQPIVAVDDDPAPAPAPAPTGENRLEFADFPMCNLTTKEMAEVLPDQNVEPCILFDIQPEAAALSTITTTNSTTNTTIITLVQVTPATSCGNARDGATTSVELLNDLNDQQGLAIGFQQDVYVQFRLVSLIGGNSDEMGTNAYGVQHEQVLSAVLDALRPQYIVGTCSFASLYDKTPALERKTMVLAQVGPPAYYEENNPYVFGVHINSDEYPLPAVQALNFQATAVSSSLTPEEEQDFFTSQPIRVIYRTKSEFFNSTCHSAIRALQRVGFQNVVTVSYDPDGDDDQNGFVNQFDDVWLQEQADRICPPSATYSDTNGSRSLGNTTATTNTITPAIFACVLVEQDVLLQRWKENGCRPKSLWMTPATWGWATDNSEQVPYIQGGSQWHPAMDYSDRFFDSGLEMLQYNQDKFGYEGTYDTVVSYVIPMIFAEHLESFYRVVDDPDPSVDFSTEEGYEQLRRAMIVLTTDTIFGPLSYDKFQRNNGRGSAGTQWQPDTYNNQTLRNFLVSPNLQAEAGVVVPAPSAIDCPAGNFVNLTLVATGGAILDSKCDECPVDTFTAEVNQQTQCNSCPRGTSTAGAVGESFCVRHDDNLLSTGDLVFGYSAVTITWSLCLIFIAWLVVHRSHPVVRISQIEFLFIICFGAMVSSSTIIALSFQAGHDEDTKMATRACQAAPFLYTIGWVLQYGSLSAKSFRLNKILNHPTQLRVKVTFTETAFILAAILLLDLVIATTWTIIHPLEYVRTIDTIEMDEVTNVMTVSSYGSCSLVDGQSMWAFVGPIIAIHGLLMIVTNIILYKVRNIGDRYQEQKYIALCSLFVCEVLVIGLPVVIAVGENSVAVFIVLSAIIALTDIGTLCFVFLPKIKFQRKGVTEGVGVGETIMKSQYKKASAREGILRSSNFDVSVHGRSDLSSRLSQLNSRSGLSLGGGVSGESSEETNSRVGEQFQRRRSSTKLKLPSSAILVENESVKELDVKELESDTFNGIVGDKTSLGNREDVDDEMFLRSKYDEVVLKNYELEKEIEEFKEKEALLEKKVEELEEKLLRQI